MAEGKGPVLIELDDDVAGPELAPPVPEAGEVATGQAMQSVLQIATRRGSKLARWFWRFLAAIVGFGLSYWAWEFVTTLMARSPVLGGVFAALLIGFGVVCLGIVLREWAGFARLRKIDGIRTEAEAAWAADDLAAARQVTARVSGLYAGRVDLEWGLQRLRDQVGEATDAQAELGLVEVGILRSLDGLAQREVETAARQVATVTAIVPIALADVAAALVANVRMIRRIAEIYGGRAGTLGSWRLTRSVLAHLVATGAVAVGDDLITSVAGGGILSKLSRRFGEGIINGALTARVGVAAMEVCRPLPFKVQKRPGVTGLVKRALAGLFTSK